MIRAGGLIGVSLGRHKQVLPGVQEAGLASGAVEASTSGVSWNAVIRRRGVVGVLLDWQGHG